MFDDQGTLRAAYDFLERFCGVRFYGPKADSVVFPMHPTLEIQPANVRREPVIQHVFRQPDLRLAHHAGAIRRPIPGRVGALFAAAALGRHSVVTNHTLHKYPDPFSASPISRILCRQRQIVLFIRGFGKARRPGCCAIILTARTCRAWICPRAASITRSCPKMPPGTASVPNARALLDACKTNVTRSAKGVEMFNDGRSSLLWFTFVNRIAAGVEENPSGQIHQHAGLRELLLASRHRDGIQRGRCPVPGGKKPLAI